MASSEGGGNNVGGVFSEVDGWVATCSGLNTVVSVDEGDTGDVTVHVHCGGVDWNGLAGN